MTYTHRLQGSRFEFKYIINEALVAPLRNFASSYLERDAHAQPELNWEYDVHSLYLDSPSLALCQATMRGHKNRFKLRVRFYDQDPEGFAFFEIKRRASDVILKQRAKVSKAAADRILGGHWPQLADLAAGSEGDFGSLQRFCSLRDTLQASGKCFVSYKREAFVTPNDNTIRVTFDRLIHATPYCGSIHLPKDRQPIYPPVGGVVLELKFTDRFPNWMRQMVEMFDLERTSMAKYVACVQMLARYPVRLGGPAREITA
ncbi:MAG: polyphosphate polymerase domain-containing protein [Planctomycetes bacterium]|nr:polyphosphate polymerase domain-containing protein [Planctomycetota bacterium]